MNAGDQNPVKMCPTLKVLELPTEARHLQHTPTGAAQTYLQMHRVYHSGKDQEPDNRPN